MHILENVLNRGYGERNPHQDLSERQNQKWGFEQLRRNLLFEKPESYMQQDRKNRKRPGFFLELVFLEFGRVSGHGQCLLFHILKRYEPHREDFRR